MKLKTTISLLSIVILATVISASANPEYEIPTIVRKDAPLNQPWNPRIDTINDSSAKNYERYLSRQIKSHVNAEIVRNFGVAAFDKFLTYYENENLKENTMGEMIDNVGRILGKSIDLQSFINLKTGLIMKKLGLMDMKLKQVAVLENTIKQVELHPRDIHSNLGNNLIWKTHMENIVDETAAVHSLYSLGFNAICSVVNYKPMDARTDIHSSKNVAPPALEKKFYPNDTYKEPRGLVKEDDRPVPTATVRADADLEKGKAELKKERKNHKHTKEEAELLKEEVKAKAKNAASDRNPGEDKKQQEKAHQKDKSQDKGKRRRRRMMRRRRMF